MEMCTYNEKSCLARTLVIEHIVFKLVCLVELEALFHFKYKLLGAGHLAGVFICLQSHSVLESDSLGSHCSIVDEFQH